MVNRFFGRWKGGGGTTEKKDKREQNNIVRVFVKTSPAERPTEGPKVGGWVFRFFWGCLGLSFRVFQGVSGCFRVCFRVFQGVSGCFRVFQGVSGCFRVFRVDDILEGQKGDQGGGPKLAKIQYGVKPDIFKRAAPKKGQNFRWGKISTLWASSSAKKSASNS